MSNTYSLNVMIFRFYFSSLSPKFLFFSFLHLQSIDGHFLAEVGGLRFLRRASELSDLRPSGKFLALRPLTFRPPAKSRPSGGPNARLFSIEYWILSIYFWPSDLRLPENSEPSDLRPSSPPEESEPSDLRPSSPPEKSEPSDLRPSGKI